MGDKGFEQTGWLAECILAIRLYGAKHPVPHCLPPKRSGGNPTGLPPPFRALGNCPPRCVPATNR